MLFGLVVVPTFFASGYMAHTLPHQGRTWAELAITMLFTVLFGWISLGFWTALTGFVVLLRRSAGFTIPGYSIQYGKGESPESRTALLMPVCNEPTHRVFSGLGSIYESLEQTGQLDRFDFFVLSDSTDPDTWVEEELCWHRLCSMLGSYGRIFYRRRRVKIKRKSGNVSDFCRRWGKNYKYMVVLDADSIMSGPCILTMVDLMERHPGVGILQTAPRAVGQESLFARIQQLANNLYGPLFIAGLQFWQLGDAHFWGHNAIIRIAPFMEHCALPVLPGNPPLGGEILSHDFVEAALMRRAGWSVWLAYDLKGSYEETPSSLLDDLKRDRRWCQGNLQHLKLLFKEGLSPAHRTMFLHGAMSYVSSILWFIFLLACSAYVINEAVRTPVYFPETKALFPEWPIWSPGQPATLLYATAVVLFFPKLLSAFLVIRSNSSIAGYGGLFRLITSIIVEILFSALLAPVRMIFYCRFVLLTLLGKTVVWGAQPRDEHGTSWYESVRYYGGGALLALIWGGLLFLINRTFFWWMTPVLIPLIAAIPLAVWSSRATTGKAFIRLRLLLIPEEVDPPPVLQSMKSLLNELNNKNNSFCFLSNARGFERAVSEPFVNGLHIALLRKERNLSPGIEEKRRGLKAKALAIGPKSLTPKEKMELLSDPDIMASLHESVWKIKDPELASMWGL
jgi:membrane glycosyltransferase